MQRTNIYLETSQSEALDRLAAEEGISRAELIRRLLDHALEGRNGDLAGDLAAIDESFGALGDVAAVERQSDLRSAHLDRIWRIGT